MSLPAALATLLFLLIVFLFQRPEDRPPPTSQRQEVVLPSHPDWEALKTIPVWEVVQNAAGGDTVRLLFDDQRDAATKAIDAKPAEIRDIVWLTVLTENMGYVRNGVDEGLHTYFFLAYGAVAPQVQGALGRTGLTERARIFSEAMAVCGTPFPTDNESRASLFFGSGHGDRLDDVLALPSEEGAFNRRMRKISDAFGSRDAIRSAIDDIVARSPALQAWVREQRAKLSDTDRLRHLTSGLVIDEKGNEAAILASWPRRYQILLLLNVFDGEVGNGGVHQFFYNSSGELAPQVVIALREIGLEKHAAAVERGIAQFKPPYPTDTETRRRLYLNVPNDRPLDQVLYRLTDDVDDGAIRPAMIDLAKRENILPH